MTYFYCHGCAEAIPVDHVRGYHEDDVNWHGLICECGAVDELEEITDKWVLEAVEEAVRVLKRKGCGEAKELNVALAEIEERFENGNRN